jgi:hypothetical protein
MAVTQRTIVSSKTDESLARKSLAKGLILLSNTYNYGADNILELKHKQ